MTYGLYIKALGILLFIFALLCFFVYCARYLYRFHPHHSFKKTMKVKEICMLDGKRKLLLITRNNEEFLLFTGPHRDFIVTSLGGELPPDENFIEENTKKGGKNAQLL